MAVRCDVTAHGRQLDVEWSARLRRTEKAKTPRRRKATSQRSPRGLEADAGGRCGGQAWAGLAGERMLGLDET